MRWSGVWHYRCVVVNRRGLCVYGLLGYSGGRVFFEYLCGKRDGRQGSMTVRHLRNLLDSGYDLTREHYRCEAEDLHCRPDARD